jgi:hypothetical protein
VIPPDAEQAFDLSRAPFRSRMDATACEVAQEIAACFRTAAALDFKLTRSVRAAMEVTGLPAAAPLFRAAAGLACDIDSGIGNGAANPYHNSQHFCEVLLASLYLSIRASLKPAAQAQLLVAALAHDFHHDGRSSIGTPFRLERLAAQATIPYLQAAGVPGDEQRGIVAMILATETTAGVPFARRCYRHLVLGEAKPRLEGIEGPLAAIATDADLALQAVHAGPVWAIFATVFFEGDHDVIQKDSGGILCCGPVTARADGTGRGRTAPGALPRPIGRCGVDFEPDVHHRRELGVLLPLLLLRLRLLQRPHV